MKKLLTVSVLAIMAVSTANAEIASTQYVNTQTGAGVDGKIVYTGQNYITSDNLKGATEQLDAAIKDVADNVGNTNVADQISAAIEGATIGQDQVSGLGDTLDGKQDLLDSTNVVTDGTGNVITKISAVDGVVTATKDMTLGALATQNTVTQAQVDGLTTALNSKQGTIADLETIRDGAALGATSLQDADIATAITQDVAQAGKLATSGLVDAAIGAAIGDLTNETEDIRALAGENKAAIEALDNTYAKDTDVSATYETKEDASAKLAEAKGYADTAEADAVAAAKTETTTQVNALAAGQVATNKSNIEANDAEIAKLVEATTGADENTTTGKYALTKIVGEGGAVSYGWELIGR